MEDLSYAAFKAGKIKPVKQKEDNSYATFLANKQKSADIQKERTSRISQGLPVSVNKNKAAPTLAGSFLRSALNPVADVAKNLLGGTNLDNKYLGKVEGLGKIDITKSPLNKDNLQTVKRSALTGLELGSYATGGSAVVGAGKNVAKQGVKEFLKTSGKQLAKEGAITSGLGSVGYQGRDGKINPLNVIRDTAIGAVAAPIIGAGVNKLFGKGATTVEKAIQQDIKPSVIKEVSKVSDKETADSLRSWINKEQRLPDPVMKKLEVTKPGINELPYDNNGNVTLYRDKVPQAGKIESYSITPKKGQEPFIINKNQVIANTKSQEMLDLFNRAYPENNIQTDANIAMLNRYNNLEGEVFVKNSTPKEPTVTSTPTNIGNKPSIESTRLNENLVKQGFDELPAEQKATYNAFQVKEQTDKITQQLDTNYDSFKQSVLDNKIPSGIQPTMAFNAVKNKAIQEGDFETQRLLAKSPLASLSSQAGSTLRATQEFSIDGADSVTIMQKLNNELEKTTEKKLGKSISQAKQELVNNAENIYKSEVKKITSKQSVADFIRNIPDC